MAAQNSVDQHPQRQKIIDAILAGTPVRDIAAWTNPPIGFNSIQRYKQRYVRPAMAHAEMYSRILQQEPLPEAVQSGTDVPDVVRDAIRYAPVLAVRERRLAALQDRHNRLQQIIEERSKEMKSEVAGGVSGLLARDYKGKNADKPVYKVDDTLLSELREHEKQAAIELGQWQEHASDLYAIQIVMPGISSSTDQNDGTRDDGCIEISLPSHR